MGLTKYQKSVKELPEILADVVSVVKTYFNENGQAILEQSTGGVALAAKLVLGPSLDRYFQRIAKKKKANFGFETYLRAAADQAELSLQSVLGELELPTEKVKLRFLTNKFFNDLGNFESTDLILVFSPKYHPAVTFVLNFYRKLLRDVGVSQDLANTFERDFNSHIEVAVANTFGGSYGSHLQDVERYQLEESEIKLLARTVSEGRIGLQENENLKYEDTYGSWRPISSFGQVREEQIEEDKNVVLVTDLIEEYFGDITATTLDKVLFLVADFGKGKSVFLRRYASQLAHNYLDKRSGYFPIYFNLRNYSSYSSDTPLGVVADYLETDFGICIQDDYFRNKRFVFLLDSLDESGELTSKHISAVVNSVRRIQSLDKSKCRSNRLIVSTRPIDEGLDELLRAHKPYQFKNDEGRSIQCFLSVHGFTKAQFNSWLRESLMEAFRQLPDHGREQVEQLIQPPVDLYDHFHQKNGLSVGELRRPIFAYMIYQLLLNGVDLSALGKIGVYLSFLNLLTKEAKHIDDKEYIIDLTQEFEFRNLLHVVAALWMRERQQGKQGILNKADICRVLDGEDKGQSDSEILERYKAQGVVQVEFLSHSYFGENNSHLHFQHQSFAEMLLAEYYLKIFVKYALDDKCTITDVQTRLSLGVPTAQTIEFLKELLALLRETVCENPTPEVLQKRKLLLPLMCSLASRQNNPLFCYDIYYRWFKGITLSANSTQIPDDSLVRWCIGEVELEKIINLAANIVESKAVVLSGEAQIAASLFSNDLLVFQKTDLSRAPRNIDKWLALLVGNNLYNNTKENRFFNRRLEDGFAVFRLARTWHEGNDEIAPYWGRSLFRGLSIHRKVWGSAESIFRGLEFGDVDFSYSEFTGLHFMDCNLSYAKFEYCKLKHVEMVCCNLAGVSFKGVHSDTAKFSINLSQSFLCQSVFVPEVLATYLNADGMPFLVYLIPKKQRVTAAHSGLENTAQILLTLFGLLDLAMSDGDFEPNKVKNMFSFGSERCRQLFSEFIYKLQLLKIGEAESTHIYAWLEGMIHSGRIWIEKHWLVEGEPN
ncbi:NACHT domain-containing protein [Kordiimonas gwangyangensis]|uniref:NACHT domain-containing protein n=1 Tax=Kordiimonas gwangyangensis TaxID=288022 RepID=UPI000470BEDB|nr:pentapeptide repeat-containing protein [Kordiimonas gwangyangensis]